MNEETKKVEENEEIEPEAKAAELSEQDLNEVAGGNKPTAHH